MSSNPLRLVLVHGAFHGPWCFERVTPLLDAAGVPSATVELPLTTLADDVDAVRSVIDDVDGDVVLLGHSYGGAVITVAGAHPKVRSLVYLTALAPAEGGGVADGEDLVQPAFVEALVFGDDGRMSVDPTRAAELFYPDASAVDASACVARLRPGGTGLGETCHAPAWASRPSDYIVCADDPILGAAGQRALAAKIGATVHELPGDHSPFLARPDALTNLLVEIVQRRSR